MKMINEDINKRYLVYHTLIIILLSLGTFSTMTYFLLFSIILIIGTIIFEPIAQAFYLIIMLAPFESILAINGRTIFFVIMFLFLLKSFVWKSVASQKKLSYLWLALSLAFLEVINEFTIGAVEVSPYALLNVISFILFFFDVIYIFDDFDFSIDYALIAFNISILIVIIITFNTYGSMSAFLSEAKQANYAFRLGNTTSDTLGGAMGIPLYASLVISFNIVSLTIGRFKKIIPKLYLFSMIVVSVIFGILSISRAFYLCFIVFVCLYIGINLLGKKKYWFASFVSILAVISIIVFLTSSDFSWILGNLNKRIEQEGEGTGIRGQIWMSCLEYLCKNLRCLFFGLSSNCYAQYGQSIGQLFSYTAHNFLIDILMSFGLIGFFILFYLFRQLVKVLKERYGKAYEKFTLLPFITYMVFGLTALRTANGKTWIYFVLIIVFIYTMRREQNE